MSKKPKFYVVWNGHKPGIYNNWEECQKQVFGFLNASYKSYENLALANEAFQKGKDTQRKLKVTAKNLVKPVIQNDSISVDAACSGNPGIMEYRGVETVTGKEIFRQGPFKEGTNNVGEFLAIVHALALLKKINKPDTIIYTDSITAMAWVRDKKPKSKLIPTDKNEALFELMDRAISWLQSNSYKNKIIKWETKKWGEIPADFGRK
ncbi:MAG: ribonuclease H family protein [Saprospiraceae bacterium]